MKQSPSVITRAIRNRKSLRDAIGHAPIRSDLPWHNSVIRTWDTMVVIIIGCHVHDFRVLCARRLNLTQFVYTTGLELTRLSVPFPVQAKTGMRHRVDFTSKFRFFPGLAAVGGYFHLLNLAVARPSQAGNLVEPGTGQLLSAGRRRDDRFRSPPQVESGRFG